MTQFGRDFQLWKYDVSHSELLLRANATSDMPSRVEILFKGVDTIELPVSMRDVSVDQVAAREYRIHHEAGVGSVRASAAFWLEDNGAYHDPSKLAGGRATDAVPIQPTDGELGG